MKSDPDIVTRLRSVLHNDRSVELMNREAADEIERLREERDEARRDVCDMMHITGFLAGDYAASRGWDCFPDMKRNVSEEVKNFRLIMERDYAAVVAQRDEARKDRAAYRIEIDRLIGQRDEARRKVCNNESNHLPTMADPRREAERRGWDCFKEMKP
jgi:hypothetical protein